MSYNSAFRPDETSTMSNVTLEYARTVASEIRETFLSGPPPPTPPPTPPPYTPYEYTDIMNPSSIASRIRVVKQ